MKAAELFDLTGEVALVTGASSGLGARFARVLAANGARVVVAARRAARLESLVAGIRAAGGEALAVEADVADEASLSRLFDEAERVFGTVTVLVNNAGIARLSRFTNMSREDWRAVMDVNLDAVVFAAQGAARRMIAANRPGVIVNIASILGYGVQKGVASYAIAKAGVIQATKAMAYELASRNIRVVALAPGYVITEMNRDWLTSEEGGAMARQIPLRRFGEEADLDGAILLLASKAGGWMTGSTLVVDGGQMIGLRD